MTQTAPLLDRLEGGLIVSCQPVDGGPMHSVASIVAMALAAQAGGARALRIEGAENVAAVVRAVDLPVIAIIKRDLDTSPVRITPFLHDVTALADAGAAVIAVDATDRVRPVPVADLLAAIHARGILAMADLSNIDEARAARQLGFDILGTTMSGYTGGAVPAEPDLAFVAACRALGGTVVAEGRYNSPELAGEAIRAGASAVCVGSAITRQEHITGWFLDAVERAAAARTEPVLAIDIGGTKSLLALVRNGEVLDRRVSPTGGAIGSAEWFASLAGAATEWQGRFSRIGAAVTGIVVDGEWLALNPKTLAIPAHTPIIERLRDAFGIAHVVAHNDAQAAAWGEYRHGAGQRRDMMFITVSSGIGGGLVLGGKLRHGARGLAGSLGQIEGGLGSRLEWRASGFGIAASAEAAGHPADTRAIVAAAEAGEDWADAALMASATDLAAALSDVQRLIDPDLVVMGGGIGLLAAFRTRLERALEAHEPRFRPTIVAAALGADAGIIGAAELAAA